MYDNTKISILIPVYNVEKYLSDCLDSVINQTMQDIEIICVNDGSTDHSLQILEEYASKDPRIKIISQENKGLLLARKVGVHHATGEYSLFLDSDDWLELNACENLYNAIKQYDVEILQCGYIIENNLSMKYKNNFNYIINLGIVPNKVISGIEAFSLILKKETIDKELWIHGKLIKTTLLKYVYESIEDGYMIWGEDKYANFILFYFAKLYYIITESYYHYRRNINSTSYLSNTYENFISKQLSHKLCYDRIKNFWASHNYNEKDSINITIKLLQQRKKHCVAWIQENHRKFRTS